MPDVKHTVLITGASGRLGRAVVSLAAARDDVNVIAASRSPEKLSALQSLNVTLRKADFDRPELLVDAFTGVDRLLLISTDELHAPGKRIVQHQAAIDAAREAGVKHIVYTSMPNPERAQTIPFAPDHTATEQALKASGIRHTILRVAWYAENLIELGILPLALSTGTWLTSSGEGAIPYIMRKDVARAACAALLDTGTRSRTLDITGPAALTVNEMAATLSHLSQKALRVVSLGDAELLDRLLAANIPPPVAPMIVATDATARAGHFNIVSNAVKALTGQPPTAFADFARQAFNAAL
ncbi:SDR family oxidoreductase [Pseudomonas sp. NPDC088368]|uniref:SDR family oxidoreductase n=1 Tax=Pseudomonas sp. NPDC088368 TaxID=3364453 RepID=UPI003815B7D7